jgi:hypothetical protein
LHEVLSGRLLGPEALAQMFERWTRLDGPTPGRPWTEHGYAVGLMTGRMAGAGRAIGHSGGGPGCVSAVYHFPDLARPVTVACFTDGEDEGAPEFEAADIALRVQ